MMVNLMEMRTDLMLPHSLSDADLASSFSDVFSEKITRIKHEFDLDLRPCVFSVTSMLVQGRLQLFFYTLSIYHCRGCKK